MSEDWKGKIKKIDEYHWQIPQTYKPGMRVHGIVFATEKIVMAAHQDKALEQVANVAFLPGIVKASLAMPDIHWGYGFSIGGVAATDVKENGVISPGGVGFDINCGIRLLRSNLEQKDISGRIDKLVSVMFNTVPCGVGSSGNIKANREDEKKIIVQGARWAVQKGFGINDDIIYTEENGAMSGADPDTVSERAYERGREQSGTLGSGNHFIEVQVVDEIYDEAIANVMGLYLGQVTIMIHSGSRGFGYQICDDYIRVMSRCLQKYNINVPDRQLCCAPVNSPEGKQYIAAMKAAANYAWCNRQCLMYLTRKAFEKVFGKSWESLGMYLVYDVAHNIAKFEKHIVDEQEKLLCVHRKGATRAFGPEHPDLPEKYKNIGQPVIIPGDMGTNSYVLIGTEEAMKQSFASTCHGAGRVKSRTAALKTIDLNKLLKDLKAKGISIQARGKKTIVEEAPEAYKDINEVVDVVHNAGISKKVCRMRPVGVIKG
ncbi:MAG: RtcB family protein [Candidatus Omnitrophota bacterium]